jgi:D-alanine transaminase/branched-chain amino acid aminotransferase
MITYPHQRQLPYIKTIDYLMAIWLQPLLKQKKVDDVLYHQNSIITECPRSNFFLINYDNSILTPADDILPGITRKNLLKLSNEFNIKEKKITIAEIKKAKSAFISSTSKIVLPVNQVDEVIFQEHDLIKDIKEAFCSIYSISA